METGTVDKPRFVETSVSQLMGARIMKTHLLAGISVFSGPWGIGKSTTIEQFADAVGTECLVIKVEPKARGVNPAAILNQIADAFAKRYRWEHLLTHTTDQTRLRRLMVEMMDRAFHRTFEERRFTIIFDEAQYLSRMSIEMLRYWNDRDRTVMPFPIGLVFVGNNEFALAEGVSGGSVLSGAVRSRLLYEVPLDYALLDDRDIEEFAKSRGLDDPDGLRAFVRYFGQSRVKRDLRQADRLLSECHERAAGRAIGADIVNHILNL